MNGMNGRPTAEHWRAVGDALEIFTARGRWAMFSPVSATLPPVTFQWHGIDDELAPEHVSVCRSYPDGSFVITLRATRRPHELVGDVAHELQHVVDAPLRSFMSAAEREQRARNTQARLIGLWWG